MMRVTCKFMLMAVAIGGLTGCGALQIPIEVPLGGETARFLVTAGMPKTNSFTTNLDTGGIMVGSGSIRIDPSAISVTPDNTQTAQTITCGDACSTAGGDATICNQVCNLGEINVTIRVGLANEVDTVCTTGDVYGPYRVVLSGTNEVVSISPNTVNFQAKTLQAFNAGAASVCVEVVSPVTGTVTISALALTAGL